MKRMLLLFIFHLITSGLSQADSWRFNVGDHPEWAAVDFDDSTWETFQEPPFYSAKNHSYRAWYRTELILPATNRPPGGWGLHLGCIHSASEVFLNGKLLGGAGIIGDAFVDAPHTEQLYLLPDQDLLPTRNVLSIRVQTSLRHGGLISCVSLGDFRELSIPLQERSERRKQMEAFILGLLSIVLLIWGILCNKTMMGYVTLGFFVALLSIIFLLESLLWYDAGLLTPFVQRLSLACFILLPAPILRYLYGSTHLNFARLTRFLFYSNLLLAGLFLLCGSLHVLFVFETAWLGILVMTILLFGRHLFCERTRLFLPAIWGIGGGAFFFFLLALGEYLFVDQPLCIRPFGTYMHIGFAGLILTLITTLSVHVRSTYKRLHRLSQQVISTRENERKRLAEELHNGFAPLIATLKLDLQLFLHKRNMGGGQFMIDHLDHLICELRNTSRKLHPAALEQLGLCAALRELVANTAKNEEWQLLLEMDIDDTQLSSAIQISLYRIVQEALINAGRHANAKIVRLNLHRKENLITLFISDDGCGCNMRTAEKTAGLGWVTLRERIASHQGTCHIASSPGKGVQIHLCIPLKKSD